jgi:DNA-binding MarR family transcriptional regulator
MPTPTTVPRRTGRRQVADPLTSQLLEALGEMAVASPLARELAAEFGVSVEAMVSMLAWLERRGLVETWRDAGGLRAMLSATAAGARGLEADARGQRWQSASA